MTLPRDFIAQDAAEARASGAVPLMIGCTGPSGSGKTFSALLMATGIQSVYGGDIFCVDTEQRRSLHYSDKFRFKHVDFSAPYSSLDYLEALRFAKKQGAGVVIVDSASHEHEGPGGLLEQHEAELTRMAGNDYAKRDRMQMLAWAAPKQKRRKLITAITTELAMPVIFCFRAKTTTKPAEKTSSDRQPVSMGFTSIGADEWLFELSVNFLFLPGSDGVPTWCSDKPGERLAIKCPDQFKWIKERKGAVTRDMGIRLAEWAKGPPAPTKPSETPEKPRFEAADVGPPAPPSEFAQNGLDMIAKLTTEAACTQWGKDNAESIGEASESDKAHLRKALTERKAYLKSAHNN